MQQNAPQENPYFVEIRRNLPSDTISGKAYDQLYSQHDIAQLESFYLWFFDRMRLPSAGYFLDVSCGTGEVVRHAKQRGLHATGMDISEQALRNAQRKHGCYIGNTSTGEALPFADNTFDILTNVGSLEHFQNPAQGVREMARVLKPSGTAYILVPNTFSLLSNVWNAFRHGYTSADDQPIQRYGARQDWTVLLQGNGLHIKGTMKYERPRPRNKQDWLYYLRDPREAVRVVVGPFIPLNLAFCFLFVCGKT